MALGNDRRTVTIRNNHTDHYKRIKRNARLKASVIVVIIAVLLVAAIYFRVDEKAVALYDRIQSSESSEKSASSEKGSAVDGLFKKLFGERDTAAETVSADEPEAVVSEEPKSEPTPVVEEKPAETTVVVTGDVELSTYVQRNYDASGIAGVVEPALRKKLTSADILGINNEFAFSTRGTPADKQYTFRVDPGYVSILEQMGVDVAGLANNHVLDYGRDALTDTFDTLRGAGIEYTGSGATMDEASGLITMEVNDIKVGFLAASRVIPEVSWDVANAQPGVFTCYDTTRLIEAIKAARPKVDFLCVCVHWGKEHTTNLTDYQPTNGHAYIDAGADAVIGAHPHVLQGVEFYSGKPIFYSLGNFIFNESIERTVAVKFVLDDKGQVKKIRLIPAYATTATTTLATGDKAAEIYSYLESISQNVTISSDGVISER